MVETKTNNHKARTLNTDTGSCKQIKEAVFIARYNMRLIFLFASTFQTW